jgi:phospholipase C
MNPSELKQNVDTIVVVMMENRSFDNVLGYLRSPQHGNRADVEGIADPADASYLNPNGDGVGLAPYWTKDGPFLSDLPHDKGAVATQLAYAQVSKSHLMNGFVKAFEDEFHMTLDRPPVMGLLTRADLPATGALADRYAVCDHWFACVPTSTAPNRLMSMCGLTGIDETGSLVPDQPTVYDWLLAHNVRWRVYAAGLPFLLLMPRLSPLMLTSHFRRLGELPENLATDPPDLRPQVIFIEPDYYDSPVHFHPPCDNHPPLAMAPGEAFLGQVYGWLTKDPAQWARTVLIVTYDEHGGFFDHVPPRPVRYRNPNGIAFETTGPRVPTILAGPFAPAGVNKTVLDNTSILQLLAERFGSPGEPYSAEVSGRQQQGIGSVSAVLSTSGANAAVANIHATPVAVPSVGAQAPQGSSAMHQCFDTATRAFVAQHQAEALAKYPELKSQFTG